MTLEGDRARHAPALQAGADEVLDASASLQDLLDAMTKLVVV